MYAWGAQFVEAHVHSRTREVRVPRMTGAFAMGHVVNPRTTHSQLMGGIVWGLGMGLMEKTEMDWRFGRAVNANLADYHVPVNADIGEIDVSCLNIPDNKFDPLGARGIGEIGITGTGAAVANAIYHATGKRIREAPITPDKLMA